MTKVVVGVDSGGTTTRAMAVSLDGRRVAYAEAGGGNPRHDAASRENVREAVRRAAEGFDVVRLVAGIAGVDREEDGEWVAETTAVEGVRGPREHVNDAVVAHHAAFGQGPGIVSVQGTGSMIMATLEDGRRVRGMDLWHYARSGAVSLGMRAVHAALADGWENAEAFAAMGVGSRGELREKVLEERKKDARSTSAALGAVARATTAAAESGDPVAGRVCRAAAADVAEGIRLLGPFFSADEVPVALVGGCVRSAFMAREVERLLRGPGEKRYRLVDNGVSPVVGAVLMALEKEGVALDEAARRGLEIPPHLAA